MRQPPKSSLIDGVSSVYKHVLEPNPGGRAGLAALTAGAGYLDTILGNTELGNTDVITVGSAPSIDRDLMRDGKRDGAIIDSAGVAGLETVEREEESTRSLCSTAKANVTQEVKARLDDYEFRYYSKLLDAVENSGMFPSLRDGLAVCFDAVAEEPTEESVQRALKYLAELCLTFIDLQRAKGQHSATEEALLLGNASKLFPELLDSHVRLAYAQQDAGRVDKAVTAAATALTLIDERLKSGARGEASVTVLNDDFKGTESLRALREEMSTIVESIRAAGANPGGSQRSTWRNRVRLRTLALTTVGVLLLFFLLLVGGARSGASTAGAASELGRATAILRISSDPAGAALYVAGEFVGRTPAAVEVPLNTPVVYSIVAGESRYRPFSGRFSAAEDKNISVWLDRVDLPLDSRNVSKGESDGSN